MATIVTQTQTPWYGQLAAGILGNVINDMLQRSQQAAQNQKTAALIGEAMRLNDRAGTTSGIGGDAWQGAYFNGGMPNVKTDNSGGGLLQGIGGNIGASGFNYGGGVNEQWGHAADSVGSQWTQAANNAINYGTSSVNNGLSYEKLAQVYGSDPRRWRSLSLNDITQAAAPYIAEAQAARQKEEIDSITEGMIKNGELDPAAILNLYTKGYIGDNAYNNINAQYNITPYQQAQLDYNNSRLNQEQARFYANMNENARQFNANNALRRQQFNADEAARAYARQNPQLQPVYDANGDLVLYNPQTGQAQNVMNNGQPVRAPQARAANGIPTDFDFISKRDLDNLDAEKKILTDRLTALNSSLYLQDNEKSQVEIKNQITATQIQLDNVNRRYEEIMQSYRDAVQRGAQGNASNSQDYSIWGDMLNGGTKTSGFGNRNGKHHDGIDIAIKAGTPIYSPAIGVPLTVTKVMTSNPREGYGNYVDLEGNVDGVGKVELRVAHMENGSIPLKVGDVIGGQALIGRVGNTGITSSPSGHTNWYEGKPTGHHMHLEVKVNGRRVDPERYSEIISQARQAASIQPEQQGFASPEEAIASVDVAAAMPEQAVSNGGISNNADVQAVEASKLGASSNYLNPLNSSSLNSNSGANSLTIGQYRGFVQAVLRGDYAQDGVRTVEDLNNFLRMNGIAYPEEM